MTLTFSSPRNLTESLCQKDESIPLIEEPIGTALLRAADRYGQQIALVDGALDVDNRRSLRSLDQPLFGAEAMRAPR